MNDKAKHITRGGQVIFHNWRMWMQVTMKLVKWQMISLVILLIPTMLLMMPESGLHNTYVYYLALAKHWLGQGARVMEVHYQHQVLHITVDSIVEQRYFHYIATVFWQRLITSVFVLFGVTSFLFYFVKRWLTEQGRRSTEDELLRGATIGTVNEANKLIAEPSSYILDKLKFKKGFKRQHLLVHGTTGVGKTNALLKLLLQIQGRGEKTLLTDVSGGICSRLYRSSEDIILNPFDERSWYWDIWTDNQTLEDFELLATFFIPSNRHVDPIWINAPRQIFAETAFKLKDDKARSHKKLLEILLTLPMKEYRKYFEGTYAAPLTDEKIEKTTLSIRAVLASYLKPLIHLDQVSYERPHFSFKKWLQDDEDRRWVFVTSTEKHLPLMLGLISAWIGCACNEILNLEEDINNQRNINIVTDEQSSFRKLDTLAASLSKIRKFGGQYMMGMQSYPQMVKHYGRDEADEIIDMLNTQIFFRSNAKNIAEFASGQLGEQELSEVKENYSIGANTIRDGISFGRQTVVRKLVLPTEIQSLDNLECYIKQSGSVPRVKLRLDYEPIKKLQQRAEAFVPREQVATDKKLEALITAIRLHEHVIGDENLSEIVQDTSEDISKEVQTAADIKASSKVTSKAKAADQVVEDTLENDEDEVGGWSL